MAESEWLDRFFRPLASSTGAAELRDDVASLSCDQAQIVTTDTIVEGIHFLSDDPLYSAGHKIVTVNVSDILAKGAFPSEAVLNLTWSSDRSEGELSEFVAGLGKNLASCDVQLIGGDTTVHDGNLVISMTLFGCCLSKRPVRRTTANAGDLLWITGRIGASGLGLQALNGNHVYREFISKYHFPAPPQRIIARAITDLATASLDVSDGLLLDASRLAQASGRGVSINLEEVPLAIPSKKLELILQQCTSGDDYEILFTSSISRRQQVVERAQSENWEVTCIGVMRPQKGLKLIYEENEIPRPERLGFVHGSTI